VNHFYFYDNFGKSGPNFIFFTVKFRKDLREKLEVKLPPLLKYIATLPCKKQVVNYTACFTALLIQFRVMKKRLLTVNVYEECYFFFSTQINFRHVIKMSVFGTFACFES